MPTEGDRDGGRGECRGPPSPKTLCPKLRGDPVWATPEGIRNGLHWGNHLFTPVTLDLSPSVQATVRSPEGFVGPFEGPETEETTKTLSRLESTDKRSTVLTWGNVRNLGPNLESGE